MTKISVIIPVYKLKKDFLKNLKHNYPFIKDLQIIVVNDDPKTKIKQELNDISKKIILINNAQNLGFAKSINQGVRHVKSPYIMLLNSDVLLQNSAYIKALSLFQNNPKLFAVSFAQKERNNRIVGANQGDFKQGLFHHSSKKCKTTCSTLWPEGGACILNTKIFSELKGFDEDYSPFYWEDVDLGYRAWQAGYEVLYYPKVMVIHHHETTISKYYSKEYIKTIAYRNQFIFAWKNSRGWQLISHFFWLPINYLQNRSQPGFHQGLKLAINKYWLKHEN